MVSRNGKLRRLVNALLEYSEEKILRLHLRRLIAGTLGLQSRNSVTSWINLLIGKKLISVNPTSEGGFIERKSLFDWKTHKLMPKVDSRYFINKQTCTSILSTHIDSNQTKQTNLFQFSDQATGPKGKDSNLSEPID